MDRLYHTLRLSDTFDIRLLRILPGRVDDSINLALEVVSLGFQNLQYEALSYTWGSLDDPQVVTCNGCQVSVTRNLHSALRRLRDVHNSRTFWVDALCINQQDHEERALQVKIMLKIYHQATRVFADLGEEVENTSDLFHLMFSLDKVLNEREHDTLPIPAKDFEQVGLPSFNSAGWVSWQKLLSRPYFTRLWVVLKFAVATTLYCLLGTTYFPWHNLYTLIHRMQIHGLAEDQRTIPTDSILAIAAIDGKNAIRTLHRMRDSFVAAEPRSMIDLLHLSRFCHSTDPKDKIFAILGLATDVDLNVTDLEIKYLHSETVAQVYIRVARYLMNSKHAVKLLYDAGNALNARQSDLPSWIPDWSVRRAGSPLGGLSQTANYHAADAVPMNFSIMSNSNILQTSSCAIGTIFDLTPEFRPDTNVSRTSAFFAIAVCEWIRLAIDLKDRCSKKTYMPTGETLTEAFWRTLIGAKTHLDTPVPGMYADEFAALLIRQRYVEEAVAQAEISHHEVEIVDATGEYARAEQQSNQFRQALQNMMFTKCFALIGEEYIGIVPGGARVGDEIHLIAGAAVPFVIRGIEGNSSILIGEGYVHGVMHGEAITKWQTTSLI